MSNPNKTETYTGQPPDAMRLKTRISGVFSEMPRGEMIAGASADVDSTETKMPAGEMKGGDGLTTGEMPRGQMTGTEISSPAGPTAIGNPAGRMTDSAGLTESEMPGGQMTSAQTGTDNGLAIRDMPSGVIASEQAEEKTTDVFPVVEITGEWLLTLSPTSLKKSR